MSNSVVMPVIAIASSASQAETPGGGASSRRGWPTLLEVMASSMAWFVGFVTVATKSVKGVMTLLILSARSNATHLARGRTRLGMLPQGGLLSDRTTAPRRRADRAGSDADAVRAACWCRPIVLDVALAHVDRRALPRQRMNHDGEHDDVVVSVDVVVVDWVGTQQASDGVTPHPVSVPTFSASCRRA